MTDSGLKSVFLRERAMLIRLFTARLGSVDEAEDALQDMWLKLDTHNVGPVGQPAAYLYRMAANLAADRRLSGARSGARDTAWFDVQPAADELPDIERTMIARERLRHVETVMAAMPERMSAALRMFRIDELPQRVIAERLGISVSGVEKLLQRAYRQIYDAGGASVEDLSERRRLSSKGDVHRDR